MAGINLGNANYDEGEPGSLSNIDYRTGPLSEAEIELQNRTNYKPSGAQSERINDIDMRWSKKRIRRELGLPEEMPGD